MNLLLKLRRYRWYLLGRLKLKKLIEKSNPLKIVIGSASSKFNGWISTDLPHFNITKGSDWTFFFKPKTIDNILAEHVLEHLTEEEVGVVLINSFNYLKEEGVFRIAVPDKNHPNQEYIEFVRPNGSGSGADDHKSFWDYSSLKRVAENIGYNVTLLEYANADRKIITSVFNNDNGTIVRSLSKGFESTIENYSSLIVDLRKAK